MEEGPPTPTLTHTDTHTDGSSQFEENIKDQSSPQGQDQEELDCTEDEPCPHHTEPPSSLLGEPPLSSNCVCTDQDQPEPLPKPQEEPQEEPELYQEQHKQVKSHQTSRQKQADPDPGSDPPFKSEQKADQDADPEEMAEETELGVNQEGNAEDPALEQEQLQLSQNLENVCLGDFPPPSPVGLSPISGPCGSDGALPGETKLCGFLQKQAGPLRSWKQRWFTYEENKNQLFYYRTPQDVMPLGCVELSTATFDFPLGSERGTFHIKTQNRTFILKAANQELMLYWLQQLQVKRSQHRLSCSGAPPTNNDNSSTDFLPVLSSPVGLVGEEAATMCTQRALLANVSIKHPLIELQNSVRNLMKRSSLDWGQGTFYECSPVSADISSAACSHACPVSPLERRRTKRSRDLQRETQMLKEELKSHKELMMVLHKALEAAQLEKRSCTEFLAVKDEQERLELLRHRERQVSELRQQLANQREETEALRRRHAETEAQLLDAQEKLSVLSQKNQAKQEVIVKLTDQVSSFVSDTQRSEAESVAPSELQQEVENLKDDIEAHKIQNKFLNSEIYQLTNLWRTSSQQEKSLMIKCAYLEATNCQLESRYLGILQKLQEVRSLDGAQRTAVQEMIEDAMKGDLRRAAKLSSDREYDQYGFKVISDYDLEDMKLLAKIQALEIRSQHLLHQEATQRPLLGRWAQYLAGRSDQDLCLSPELKFLVRGGVPPEYRPRVWRCVVQARTKTIREHYPERYNQLCDKSRASPHSASRQIELDLNRTLTTNRHFSSPCSPALQQLRRILLAFSWQNPTIGYCQGLNRLAALALVVLQSEEEAFWCLVAMVETIMPKDYYTKNLLASQADQRVLKDLMADKLPRLWSHFESHSVDVSLVSFNWFLVIFVESLHTEILLQLWDAFLYEGTKVIFRYALALFKYKEEEFLKIQDSVQIYQYLRFFTKTISDSRKLSNIAFAELNPFPGRLLRSRRAVHRERLQRELLELQEQQEAFSTESVQRRDKDVSTAASEDDDDP
ncbi:TBC1 domain family member 2A isoform X2 [Gouania willdenowi]|uniref:TBC1 domain family member 2A isoform X2 n=1 Tax=Gouania willdenowi TaxID=441366 RepID=UPI00105655DD|nr:TBC1 domain family member 2A isoform X2 [Gouania willdenowi]